MAPRKKPASAAGSSKPASTSGRATRSKAKAPNSTATPSKEQVPSSKRLRSASAEPADDEPSSKKQKVVSPKADANVDASVDQVTVEDKKMVSVLIRGSAPVDPQSGLILTHQVYANDEGVWDAMLNQTNIGGSANSNKFYVIQLLHPIGNASFCVLYVRWGRVGEFGQNQQKGPWAADVAIREFKKQFRSKTGVAWEQRQGMTPKKGKYVWIERSFEDETEQHDDEKREGKGDESVEEPPPSTLAPELLAFCEVIFSTTLMAATLSSMNYDANKLPLGKLAKSTILNGFSALKTLAEVLGNPNSDIVKEHGSIRAACEQLSGQYYSIIPHAFGRNRPTVIDNIVLLKKELELVDALGDMEIAQKLINSAVPKDIEGRPINPVDAQFMSLELSAMDPIQKDCPEYECLNKYLLDTHGATHSYFHAKLLNAFRVERQTETAAWVKAGFNELEDGERLLLWHGSRATNFAGILKQGLRIAPPEAPVSGYMFGKGVYFADMMSKSANYCHAHTSNGVGVLLLCEVAAKPFYEQTSGNFSAGEQCAAAGKRATKGLGRIQHTKWKDAGKSLNNDTLVGCHMPDSQGEDVSPPNCYLEYNEYIIYDVSQIRLRYLLMVDVR